MHDLLALILITSMPTSLKKVMNKFERVIVGRFNLDSRCRRRVWSIAIQRLVWHAP